MEKWISTIKLTLILEDLTTVICPPIKITNHLQSKQISSVKYLQEFTREATVLTVSSILQNLFFKHLISIVATGSHLYRTQGEVPSPNHFNSSGFMSSKLSLF